MFTAILRPRESCDITNRSPNMSKSFVKLKWDNPIFAHVYTRTCDSTYSQESRLKKEEKEEKERKKEKKKRKKMQGYLYATEASPHSPRPS